MTDSMSPRPALRPIWEQWSSGRGTAVRWQVSLKSCRCDNHRLRPRSERSFRRACGRTRVFPVHAVSAAFVCCRSIRNHVRQFSSTPPSFRLTPRMRTVHHKNRMRFSRVFRESSSQPALHAASSPRGRDSEICVQLAAGRRGVLPPARSTPSCWYRGANKLAAVQILFQAAITNNNLTPCSTGVRQNRVMRGYGRS